MDSFLYWFVNPLTILILIGVYLAIFGKVKEPKKDNSKVVEHKLRK